MKILLAIPAPVWLIVSASFFAAGEYLSKKWGYAPSISFTAIVVGTYALATLFWLPALLHKNSLAVMGTAWLLLATAATVGIGILVFHEQVNALQWAGIALSCVALVLLSL